MPFDTAQDTPFDTAQDMPFDPAQDMPFDTAQDMLSRERRKEQVDFESPQQNPSASSRGEFQFRKLNWKCAG